MSIFSFLFGRRKSSSVETELGELTQMVDEDCADVMLRIVESNIQQDGNGWVEAYSLHEGERVGLRVGLIGPWEEGPLLWENMQTYQGLVCFVPTGEASNRLVQAMCGMYGSSIKADSMNSKGVLFTGITLEGNPIHAMNQLLRIKLFVESYDDNDVDGDDNDDVEDERYAELFIIIDISKGWIGILEKDPEYRDPIIRALAGL